MPATKLLPLKLDTIRAQALRAGRLAETLFGTGEADVVAIDGGQIWRGKPADLDADEATSRWVAGVKDQAIWVSDTQFDPATRDLPDVQTPDGIRFCVVAPIQLQTGDHVGAIRVVDRTPREFDPNLLARLEDLAAMVGSECDRQLESQPGRLRAIFDRSQARLKEALSATQAIIDHSYDVICTLDADGVFTQVGKHAEKLWSYRPEDLVGRHYHDLLHPDDVAASLEVRRQILAGRPTTAYTNRCLHRDGIIVPVMWSLVWSEIHQTMYVVARDMREHVAAEEKLRQSQKMEAVGRLTGGLAHDFNNLLTVIIGSAESLTDALVARPELLPMAELALEAAERGADLVSRLLIFARNQPMAPQAINCGRLLASIQPILRGTIRQEIEIEVEVAPEDSDLRCLADRTQLTSALLNLCINARDAIPGTGKLTLSVARAPAPEGVSPTDRWDGPEVIWSVRDDGEGMSPQVLDRALEPFYTTKPVGQGTGLGLSMVYGFAIQSGGRIEIESAPDTGTTVKLYLPQTSQQEELKLSRPRTEAPTIQNHVLLVEDDDLLRGQVRRQLGELGYRVTDAANGHAALEILRNALDLDLLFTDVVMPGMNGRQLAEHARMLIPGLPIIFTSGHTEDAMLRSGRFDDATQFLPKPYRRGDLAATLERALHDG